MEYTIEELIKKLEQFPKKLKIQIDCDAGIYDEVTIDQVGKDRVVIFPSGESKW